MPQEGLPHLTTLVQQGEVQVEAERLAEGVFGVRDISNAYLVTSDDGDLMINTGFMDNAARNRNVLAPHRTGPLRAIVLTQSHADHFGGLDAFAEEGAEIIAGPGYWRNWQDTKRLQPFFGPRTKKLWGATLKRGSASKPPPDRQPDREIGDSYILTVGQRRFELLHTPEGETTDGLTVWLPCERIAFTGNLFGPVWLSMPFLTTLRGDKPRSVRSYLASLERVRALEPAMIVTGHGDPIRGAERIRADLNRMHAAVSHVRDATLDDMNAGKPLEQLMEEIALPADLVIGEYHGKVSWAIKAIWFEYAGWFRYASTTELYGVPQSAVYGDLVDLAGGAGRLGERAMAKVEAGHPLQALHLTDIALNTAPDDPTALGAKRAALAALLERSGQSNLSETMWLKSELAAVDDRLQTSAAEERL